MSGILIKNGLVVTGINVFKTDLFIQNGLIHSIDTDLSTKAEIMIDASGKYVFPGGIDGHVHMNVPCIDGSKSAGYGTESIAAAVGGTTTIIDYVLQEDSINIKDTLKASREEGLRESVIDFGQHLIVKNSSEQTLKEIPNVINEGITSFKLFMANELALRDKDIYYLMKTIGEYGGLACVHAENHDIIEVLQNSHESADQLEPYYHAVSRPLGSENEAINRAIHLAELANCPVLIAHVSSKEGIEIIKDAKWNIHVYAETCPHYLWLDDTKYQRGSFESAKHVISPPLRSKKIRDSLLDSIMDNSVDIISSDHNGFKYSTHKQLGRGDYRKIPNGAPGIEHRFILAYEYARLNSLNLSQFVRLTSENAARLFGLYPQKGIIAPGSDADIIIFDPNAQQTITALTQHQDSDYTPYEGINIKGKVDTVISRGEIIVSGDGFIGQKGRGKFIKRKTYDHSTIIN